MKNPLRKRLLRELKNDIGKYLVIFLFMTATIGFVSGFLVADESMLYAYDESFEKYNVENGNFTTEQKLTDNQRTRLEKEKVTIYENFYKDEDADTDLDSEPESTIRLFKNRTEVNLVAAEQYIGDESVKIVIEPAEINPAFQFSQDISNCKQTSVIVYIQAEILNNAESIEFLVKGES